ncbi:sulfurtransferase TusA family protein [Citreimonas sp.]|uniref:sulfurtransferase TusA family protein n=1 Tax=Citreimonas sp. TaxID=3036715 RepID=UPI0035C7A6CF
MDSIPATAYLHRMSEANWDHELDARGLLCPLPVLKARKRLQGLPKGAVLRVVADDPAAVVDVPHFCAESGNSLVGTAEEAGAQVYLIRKV